MNRSAILFLFVLLMTGLAVGVYASLASFPAAVPTALQGSRNLVLLGETAAFMLMLFVLGFLAFAISNGVASAGSVCALVLGLTASGYGIFYLVSTPGLLF